ncbi:hypothetical protein SS1G_10798 [Sclerotinia sclerotiorum 1980 UF-70]|uniref:Small ribosomal subunit protein mS35 mitochondrial conserved domain-containing protein n=1 Tax=Sclerotinia sclerotiorum (strain ATCC 18683 / 1980 / Ss-1) TaxID=665079 RepID=A7EZN1_SCLS1|nr:hypothetical protein SS1G_10798 [Sclerotinia sclerotiorum 1980 UF-70]EDN94923.1 hypothetical protein SS1G_10798 [Sclerotinia sclerotiorum 1980 UF-70]
MATALQSLRMTARCCSCRNITSRYTSKAIAQRRLFSTTPRQYKIDPKFKDLEETEPDEDEFMEEIDDLFENAGARHANNLPSYGFDEGLKKKLKPTFLNMGDPEPFDEDDREDDHDDITTLAHMELEQVREIRHYNRLAAWEMPMLSKLAKPFVPPSTETPLRFRKLVGTRLNPETDIVKMSCEMYPSQAQNKRYLGDLVDSLLAEAKTGDTFEDVPLDTRHHVFKTKPKFPVGWRLTEERKKELEQYRRKMVETDSNREHIGQLVDGIETIQQKLSNPKAKEPVPETIAAGGRIIANKKVVVKRLV